MRSRVAVGGGRSMETSDVTGRKPDMMLGVPVRELVENESIVLGFRREMLSMGEDGDAGGDVTTGTGLGTDFIILKWGERQALVRGVELLREWVRTFAPEDAERFPG